MSAWNGVYEVDPNDPHALCDQCAEEHPERVLEDGLCSACVDENALATASYLHQRSRPLAETKLTPLELAVLRDCAARGSTRCNDGGLVDTLLSGLCSKPSPGAPYVRWRMNPTSRTDGYISLYTVTDAGRAALQPETPDHG